MGRLTGARILITAGPTEEPIDPVRFLSNRSSGRLGYALARIARNRGAKVTLITGPTTRKPPTGVRVVQVTTAREMHATCRQAARTSDIIIMAAAVADYRPKTTARRKLKRRPHPDPLPGGRGSLHLELVPNPDILADLCKHRRNNQYIVGFALETDNLLKNARKKLRTKGCDMLVANPASALTARLHRATILHRDGSSTRLPGMRKEQLARAILGVIASVAKQSSIS